MTHHASLRTTARPFQHNSPDIYWRNPKMYAAALVAIATDAEANYTHVNARSTLVDMLRTAALEAEDLMIPFEAQYLFTDDAPADSRTPLVITPCYPYAARHYANIIADMRDYAVASLADGRDENVYAFGSLPALLSQLEQNLLALTVLERGDDRRLASWLERPTRIPLMEKRPTNPTRSTPNVTR